MAEKDSYFRSTPNHPYHLSVGAVLINDQNEVACHYFESLNLSGTAVTDFYILMRETAEPNETLEQVLARGLMEEFGAKGKILGFLGSHQAKVTAPDYIMKKTTLYFLTKLESIDSSLRDKDDPEFSSDIQWQPFEFLIGKMENQFKRLRREDIDEAGILKRAQKFLKSNPT